MDFDTFEKTKISCLLNTMTYLRAELDFDETTAGEPKWLYLASLKLLTVYIYKRFDKQGYICHLNAKFSCKTVDDYKKLLVSAALGITIKWYMDLVDYTNTFLASVFRVSTRDLTYIEKDILETMNYDIFKYMPEARY